MTKRIKYLSLLMAVIMCFSLFVGCKQDINTEPPDTDGTSADTTAKPADVTLPPVKIEDIDVKEPMHILTNKVEVLSVLTAEEANKVGIPTTPTFLEVVDDQEEYDAFIRKYSLDVKDTPSIYFAMSSYVVFSYPFPSCRELSENNPLIKQELYEDRFEINIMDTFSDYKYASYAIYCINMLKTQLRDEIRVSRDAWYDLAEYSEITDFTQYQVLENIVLDNFDYGIIKSTPNPYTNHPIVYTEYANSEFKISQKELYERFDEKFFEEYSVVQFFHKYSVGDCTNKVVRIYGNLSGIAIYFDGDPQNQEFIYDEQSNDYIVRHVLVFPKKYIPNDSFHINLLYDTNLEYEIKTK